MFNQYGRIKKPVLTTVGAVLGMLAFSTHAYSDDQAHPDTQDGMHKHTARADGHAPIGVMGDHRHNKGGLMLSYRFMRMGMEGNLDGSNSVSPETIVTTVPNRFFGTPGQPPTLRVVPTKMNMDMHMFGAMYGVSDTLTLMAMLPYLKKEMDHVTFGINLIGQRGSLCGHRLACEVGAPIYQNLNGPQMETDWTFTIGWQKSIGDC